MIYMEDAALTNPTAFTDSGGTVSITGLLDLTGVALVLDPSKGMWQFQGGEISGGTISTTSGSQLSLPAGSSGSLFNSVVNLNLTVPAQGTLTLGEVTLENPDHYPRGGFDRNRDFGRIIYWRQRDHHLWRAGRILIRPDSSGTLTLGSGVTPGSHGDVQGNHRGRPVSILSVWVRSPRRRLGLPSSLRARSTTAAQLRREMGVRSHSSPQPRTKHVQQWLT